MRRRHNILPLKGAQVLHGEASEQASDSEELDEVELEENREEALANATVDPDAGAEVDSVQSYFVTVSRRTGFRRLHIVGGCHVQQSRCQEAYGLSPIEGAQFNAMCEVCKSRS